MSGTLGAILAGGQSRRFGSDKALARLHGKTLLAHVKDRLTPQVDAVVVCGHADGGLADRPEGGLGPLAGLNAALHHAARLGFAAVLSAPCDAPLLPDDLLAQLRAAGTTAFALGCPVVGLWPSSLAPRLDAYLSAAPDRSMRGWIGRCAAVAVDLGPVVNINHAADLFALADARLI